MSNTKTPNTSITLQKPNVEEFRAAQNKIHRKIEELKAQQNAINERIQKEFESEQNKAAKEEQKALRQNIAKGQAFLKQKQLEKEKLTQSIRDLDKQKVELRKKQKEYEKSTSAPPPDIDAQIRHLELELETAPGTSLKKESKIMNDIKRLQHSKKHVKQKEDFSGDLASLDEKRKAMLDQVEALQLEIEKTRNSQSELYQQVQQIGEKHASMKDSLTLLHQEKHTLGSEISKQYDELRVLKEKFSEENAEWKRKIDEEKKKEAERRQAAEQLRQERQQQIMQEKLAKEEEKMKAQKEIERLRRLNPHEEEIVTCDILIHFLTNSTSAREKQRTVQQFNANAFAKEGMQQFKRSPGDEDAWLFADRGKSKKGGKKPPLLPKEAQPASEPQAEETSTSCSTVPKPKAPKNDKLLPAMPVAKLQAFDKLRIRPPIRQSEVSACVEELRKKKVYFESFKRTMEQVIEDERKEQLEKEKLQMEQEQTKAEEISSTEVPTLSATVVAVIEQAAVATSEEAAVATSEEAVEEPAEVQTEPICESNSPKQFNPPTEEPPIVQEIEARLTANQQSVDCPDSQSPLVIGELEVSS